MSSWTVWILFHMYGGKLSMFLSISHFKITGYHVLRNAELYHRILYMCIYGENDLSLCVCTVIFYTYFKLTLL